MTEIECGTRYYGFILSEFVAWELTKQGHLIISTLTDSNIYIPKDKWQYKRSLLGSGKIEFKLAYNDSIYAFRLKMNPIRERESNEELFFAGRNGPWNLSSRPFSSIFPRGRPVDPNSILDEIGADL
jgi:hypothetical protein